MGPLQKAMIPVLIEVFVPRHIGILVVKPNQTSVHSRCQRISSTPQTREFHQKSQISTSPSWKYSCATKIEAQQILLCLSICHLSFHIVYIYIYHTLIYISRLSCRRNSSDKAPLAAENLEEIEVLTGGGAKCGAC